MSEVETPRQGETAATQAETMPDRTDRVQQTLTTAEGEFTVEAELKNGEAQFIVLTDNNGMETTFPAQVLGQLIAAVGTQESMIRNAMQREQMARYGNQNMIPGALAGLQQRVY